MSKFSLIKLSLSLIFQVIVTFNPRAQEAKVELTSITSADSSDIISVGLEKPKFTPFIAPSYSPEIDFMVIAGGLFTFKLKPLNQFVQRSSVPFSIGYSTNNSFLVNLRPSIYGKKDRWRLSGDISIRNMPDNYFGVGYESGRYIEKSDSTTAYDRKWWQVDLRLVRRILPNFYGGLRMDLNKTKASSVNPLMEQEPNFQEFGAINRNSGLGPVIQWDSRDLGVNAYKGVFLSLMATYYSEILGGENEFQVYEFDYRQYKSIKRKGRTLAWHVKTIYSRGDVPWSELPKVGTPWDLRGYRWGRFRDQTILLGMLEYRHMFTRKNADRNGRTLSRHGLVSWVGAGSLGSNYSDMDNWLPNIGVGYRFEVQSRMGIRVDFGLGKDSMGAYVSFNEAF